MKAVLENRLVRFLFAGGVAAAANYGSRFLFSIWFRYELAIVFAYLVGMSVAFILMRGYVFDARHGALGQQIVRFVGVNILAVIQTLLISILLARWGLPALGMRAHVEAFAPLVGVLIPVMTSYIGHRLLTFRVANP